MEEKKEDQRSFLLKLIGFLFALLIVPLKFFIANPKVFFVFLAIAASIGGTVYFARTNPKLLGIQSENAGQEKEDVEKLVSEVAEIISLPEGETPTLATVTDVEKVKEQLFFSKAQNGDKVLIFSLAKKAFLYRPGEKKIIEVGIVNLGKVEEVKEVNGENNVVSEATPTPTLSPTSEPTKIPSPTTNPE